MGLGTHLGFCSPVPWADSLRPESASVFPTPTLASLLPKLRDQYAEFLDHVSLVHLRLLASPTCVGLRYGHPAAPHPAFLARRLYRTRVARRLPFPSALGRCRPTALDGQSTRPRLLRFGVPEWFDTTRRGRNVNRLSIGYAFGASP